MISTETNCFVLGRTNWFGKHPSYHPGSARISRTFRAKAIVTNEIVKSGRFAQRTCGGFFHTAVLMAKYLLVKGGALRLAYQSRREPLGIRITQWLVV